jgi:hypothetical protein
MSTEHSADKAARVCSTPTPPAVELPDGFEWLYHRATEWLLAHEGRVLGRVLVGSDECVAWVDSASSTTCIARGSKDQCARALVRRCQS